MKTRWLCILAMTLAGAGLARPFGGMETPAQRLVTIKHDNVEVRTVLGQLAREGGVTILTVGEARGRVSVSVRQRPVSFVLDMLVEAKGWQLTKLGEATFVLQVREARFEVFKP